MNAERLQGIIDFLLKAEISTKIQERLSTLRVMLGNLAANPADPTHQSQTVAALSELRKTVSSFAESLSAAQNRNLTDVKAHAYFSNDMVAEIADSFARNGVTPAVVQQQVNNLSEERQRYLDTLRSTQVSLNTLGIKSEPLSPGEAEIGFLIPRALFNNNLDDFQDELKTLNSIIRTFYEISNVTPEPISLRQLSTSDPIIFLGGSAKVLITIGKAINWCSDTIRGTMEIKRIVDAARAASVEQAVVESLEQQIEKRIAKCIEDKIGEMAERYCGDSHRKNELMGPLEKSLEQLLERVANGMTVEIGMLPPAKKADGTDADEKLQFDQLKQIARELAFPQISPGQPMLQISRDRTDSEQPAVSKRKSKAQRKTDDRAEELLITVDWSHRENPTGPQALKVPAGPWTRK